MNSIMTFSPPGVRTPISISSKISGNSYVEYYQYEPRDIADDIPKYMPNYYNEIQLVQEILKTEINEFIRFNAINEDTLLQTFVDDMSWSLDVWEKRYGVRRTYNTIERRREEIRKHKFFTEVLTNEFLNKVLRDYTVDAIDVVEYPKENKVEIIMQQITKSEGDVEVYLRHIIPSHLDISTSYIQVVDQHLISPDGTVWSLYASDVGAICTKEVVSDSYIKYLELVDIEGATWNLTVDDFGGLHTTISTTAGLRGVKASKQELVVIRDVNGIHWTIEVLPEGYLYTTLMTKTMPPLKSPNGTIYQLRCNSEGAVVAQPISAHTGARFLEIGYKNISVNDDGAVIITDNPNPPLKLINYHLLVDELGVEWGIILTEETNAVQLIKTKENITYM